MSLPRVVSPQEWRAARVALLAEEKAMTPGAGRPQHQAARAADAAGEQGVRLRRAERSGQAGRPVRWPAAAGCAALHVRPGVGRRLPELLSGGRRGVDGAAGALAGPRHDVRRRVASAAAEDRELQGQARLGLRLVLLSRGDFNYDFHVCLDASVAPVEFTYRDVGELRAAGLGWVTEAPTEQPGYSVFLRTDDGSVFHSYSTYGRGTEWVGGSYAFLDLTPLGRQEEWEEPKERSSNLRGAVPDFAS